MLMMRRVKSWSSFFVQAESTFTYFNATRRYIERHGKPLAFYSDKAGIFRINNKNAIGGDGHTQFGRAMFVGGLLLELWGKGVFFVMSLFCLYIAVLMLTNKKKIRLKLDE